jgi:aspartate/methionine/tyrosine aminotransferase
MQLNPVLENLGAYPIATVHERAQALREAGVEVIDFSIGDPREPTPEFIVAALRAGVPEVSQYPLTAGRRDLRRAIADYLARRFGVAVDADTQVIPTSGSKEAIFTTPLAFVDAAGGDTVVYPTPGYPVYERGARFAGAEAYPVVLSGDFVLRAGSIPEDVWDRARLVWTCSPSNPTGSVAGLDDLRALLERSRRSNALFLSDECYADLYEAEVYPEGPASALQVAGEGASGLLCYLSCSKRSGMRTTTGTASPDFVQAAAIAAWSDDVHAAERRDLFARKRKVVRAAFDAAGLDTVQSHAGLYLWVAVDDDLIASSQLLDAGVVVSPGRFFGPGGEGFLRLALVPSLDECEAAADIVVRSLSQ